MNNQNTPKYINLKRWCFLFYFVVVVVVAFALQEGNKTILKHNLILGKVSYNLAFSSCSSIHQFI